MPANFSYPLSLPTEIEPYQSTLIADQIIASSESPFTNVQQKQVYDGDRWKLNLQYRPMKREDVELFYCFILKLNGIEGSFLYEVNALVATPRGVATGTPKVNGSNLKGSKVLATKGWTTSTPGVLKAGDFIQIGNRLYKNLTDVNSNGSGNVSIDIYPALREDLSDNTTIITSNCKGLFQLVSNSNPVMAIASTNLFDVTITAIEAI